MTEQLKDIALRVGNECFLSGSDINEHQILTFATRLVEELGTQKPVACVTVFDNEELRSVWHSLPEGQHKLYSAPVIPAGMVMGPEEPKTGEICNAGCTALELRGFHVTYGDVYACYEAMLAQRKEKRMKKIAELEAELALGKKLAKEHDDARNSVGYERPYYDGVVAAAAALRKWAEGE